MKGATTYLIIATVASVVFLFLYASGCSDEERSRREIQTLRDSSAFLYGAIAARDSYIRVLEEKDSLNSIEIKKQQAQLESTARSIYSPKAKKVTTGGDADSLLRLFVEGVTE